jgi:hypothetical protein
MILISLKMKHNYIFNIHDHHDFFSVYNQCITIDSMVTLVITAS